VGGIALQSSRVPPEAIFGGGSGFEEAGGNAVIAVELDVVKGGGNAVPAGGGSWLNASNVSPGSDDYVAAAHGAANQDNFDLDGVSDSKLFRAKKKATSGANVAGNERNREVFGDILDAAETQGELQTGSWIFPLLGIDANRVSGDASKTADVVIGEQGRHAQGREAWRFGNGHGTWCRRGGASLSGRLG
jgi:hypothetical protein